VHIYTYIYTLLILEILERKHKVFVIGILNYLQFLRVYALNLSKGYRKKTVYIKYEKNHWNLLNFSEG
jgi:hypothetical protein